MKKLFTFLLFCLSFQDGFSQQQFPGNQIEVVDTVKNIFFNDQRKDLLIYNGRRFHGYSPSMREHPFFKSSDWQPGRVHYENIWYNDLQLKYDGFKDELIVMHPSGMSLIMIGERINEFYIGDHYFKRLDTLSQAGIKTGFYEFVNDGKISLVINRNVIITESLETRYVIQTFTPQPVFFLVKNNEFIPVRNKGQALKLTGKHRAAINRELRNRNIRYREQTEMALLVIVEMYNQLEN